ncbi:CotH kinase family protein [Nonlabens ponticola]|uniref:Spore coat protein CotH n=1 Tax=Nonlabens ponticola TaxID=2496866 RepID=A0A3S9MY92_9FLAO|nr:CotH kinase family protein [Nonlabens ponticola]AZQ44221.1 hypothetical protein EJ995_08225 [Nonlabens ponticola]
MKKGKLIILGTVAIVVTAVVAAIILLSTPGKSIPTLDIHKVNIQDSIARDDYTVITVQENPEAFLSNTVLGGKIRHRGHSTWLAPKKPYQMKLDKSNAIGNMPPAKKWILLANYYDKTMLRNSLAFEMSRMSKLSYTPQSQFFNVNIDGDWHGLFLVTEKIELQKNRITKDNGYLLELDHVSRLKPDDASIYTKKYTIKIKEPDITVDDQEFKDVKQFILDTEQAFFNSNENDYSTYKEYVDMETLVDWYILQEISRNQDANFYSSVYFTYKPGGKLKFGPVWDFDIGFGNINYSDNYEIEGYLLDDNEWLKYILEDPEFIALRKKRYSYFYEQKDRLLSFLDNQAAIIEPTVISNHKKYHMMARETWPNRVIFTTYMEYVEDLKQWLSQRMDYLNEEFVIKQDTISVQ